MLADFALLLAGLILIVKGGDLFVAAAVRLAELLRMPRVVIGSTLVSLATTSPELVVSVMAGMRGESGLALGNAVGSCICNIGLILGLTAAFKQVSVHPRVLLTPMATMLGFGLLSLLMTFDLLLVRWQGAVLLAGGVAYFSWDFWQHWRDRRPLDAEEAVAIQADVIGSPPGSRWPWLWTRTGTTVQFLVAAGIVVAGSRLLVDGASALALGLGIPSIVIGLTIVAVGTSLPELVTAITSSRQRVSDLAVGNVLGANIANLTLVVGAAAIFNPVAMDRVTQLFNFPAMLALMGMLVWMLMNGQGITRREGATLLWSYVVYIAVLVTLTLTVGKP